MGRSGALARSARGATFASYPMNSTTDTNNSSTATTGAATVTAASSETNFLGFDTTKARHVVARFVPDEGAKPAVGMATDTLLARVAQWRKVGADVHCFHEAGPTGFSVVRRVEESGSENFPANSFSYPPAGV